MASYHDTKENTQEIFYQGVCRSEQVFVKKKTKEGEEVMTEIKEACQSYERDGGKWPADNSFRERLSNYLWRLILNVWVVSARGKVKENLASEV